MGVGIMARRTREKQRQELHGQTYVPIDGIAEYCMVSRTTIHRWVAQGRMRATKLPSGHLRVTAVDFRDFLKRNKMAIGKELLENSKS
jgi:excisionase family DNA binding protein